MPDYKDKMPWQHSLGFYALNRVSVKAAVRNFYKFFIYLLKLLSHGR